MEDAVDAAVEKSVFPPLVPPRLPAARVTPIVPEIVMKAVKAKPLFKNPFAKLKPAQLEPVPEGSKTSSIICTPFNAGMACRSLV